MKNTKYLQNQNPYRMLDGFTNVYLEQRKHFLSMQKTTKQGKDGLSWKK